MATATGMASISCGRQRSQQVGQRAQEGERRQPDGQSRQAQLGEAPVDRALPAAPRATTPSTRPPAMGSTSSTNSCSVRPSCCTATCGPSTPMTPMSEAVKPSSTSGQRTLGSRRMTARPSANSARASWRVSLTRRRRRRERQAQGRRDQVQHGRQPDGRGRPGDVDHQRTQHREAHREGRLEGEREQPVGEHQLLLRRDARDHGGFGGDEERGRGGGDDDQQVGQRQLVAEQHDGREGGRPDEVGDDEQGAPVEAVDDHARGRRQQHGRAEEGQEQQADRGELSPPSAKVAKRQRVERHVGGQQRADLGEPERHEAPVAQDRTKARRRHRLRQPPRGEAAVAPGSASAVGSHRAGVPGRRQLQLAGSRHQPRSRRDPRAGRAAGSGSGSRRPRGGCVSATSGMLRHPTTPDHSPICPPRARPSGLSGGPAPARLESPPHPDGGSAMRDHSITMLGTGLIGDFYTMTLHGQRGRDRVRVVYSRTADRGAAFSQRWDIPESTTDLQAAIDHPDTDVVVVALPNHLHEEAVDAVAAAGKAVLCTKPLGRNADEARRMLRGGREGGHLRGLPRGPVLHAQDAQGRQQRSEDGAIGEVTWVRSREAHPGPHSAWFWDGRLTGGGAIIDLGCHCIEIIRNFIGKGNRPVEVMCRHGHAGPPHRRRGQRDRAHPLRVGRHRPVRGLAGPSAAAWTCATRSPAPTAPSGSTTSCAPASRCSPRAASGGYVAEKAETEQAGCSRWATRSPSWATWTCSRTCSRPSMRAARRRRRSTTATS